jgi:hypothetical protein
MQQQLAAQLQRSSSSSSPSSASAALSAFAQHAAALAAELLRLPELQAGQGQAQGQGQGQAKELLEQLHGAAFECFPQLPAAAGSEAAAAPEELPASEPSTWCWQPSDLLDVVLDVLEGWEEL